MFQDFCTKELNLKPKFSVKTLSLFLSFLYHKKNYAPRTIRVAASAISYFSQSDGGQQLSSHFKIEQLMKRIERRKGSQDTRLPLTIEQMENIFCILEENLNQRTSYNVQCNLFSRVLRNVTTSRNISR